MKWLKRLAAVLGVLIAVLAVAPFFISASDYIPTLEKEISARVGEPVSIENVRLLALPVPRVRIDGISVGSSDDIQVARVTLTPNLWTLMWAQKVIRTVEVEDVTMTQEALGAVAALMQGDRGTGTFRVETVRLQNATVKLREGAFGPFDMDVRVSRRDEPGDLRLVTRDGALKAHATPDGDRFLLDLTAKSWTPPIGPHLEFDALAVKGVLRAKQADLSSIDARIYGGTVAGTAAVGWEKGVEVKGNLVVQQVELQQVFALASSKAKVSGKLDAKPVFSARAPMAAGLDDALRLETPFSVRDGVLHGFDLMAAAGSLGKKTSGGETRFQQLAGRLVLERRTYRFTELKIASGPLAARGNATVSPSRALSGRIDANADVLGRVVTIPLVLGGTLDSPMLLPNASALVGAAAGSAVLGPGLGTAAGAKIGEFVEGLLGNSRKK